MPPQQFSKKLVIFLLTLGIFLLLIGAAPSVYFYNKYQNAQKMLKNSKDSLNEVQVLTERVGKLIDLPTGENPIVITVTDVTKVQDQPFFARAKSGDKILVYNQAKKAILYDPSADKIIEVGPLIIPSSTPALSETPSPSNSSNFLRRPIPTTSP